MVAAYDVEDSLRGPHEPPEEWLPADGDDEILVAAFDDCWPKTEADKEFNEVDLSQW